MISPCNAIQISKIQKNQPFVSGEMTNEMPSNIHVTPVIMNKRTYNVKLYNGKRKKANRMIQSKFKSVLMHTYSSLPLFKSL